LLVQGVATGSLLSAFILVTARRIEGDGVDLLPSGTVTFLFTDVVGSTRLWEEFPELMRSALARHDGIIREVVESRSGHVVKGTGDGMHAVFARAYDAISAAIAIQQAFRSEAFDAMGQLRVRVGVHTSEAELREGDYYGTGVNRAARLMSVAHGGQIVVSSVTAQLCDNRFELTDLGEHRLRDLSRAERVWQVDIDGERFPPLASLDNLPGNLPMQMTEFIGRTDDVVNVAKALDGHRVVTLTGVGGVGKTRLALQVAAEFADRFRHGTWFCDLAPAMTSDGVVGAIADALAVDTGTATRDEALCAALRQHQALLVVDNCEHVLDEAARVVERLARECAELSILATSREGLGAPGEQILTVRSLRVPEGDAPADDAAATESVRLFVDRARSVRTDLALDDSTVDAIAEICRRLDGIPLAIELAAARAQSLTASEINERLDQRFRLLTRGGRAARGRHDTLRTTIDWSYQLLEDAERAVLARSSVFSGGFSLQAAERVVSMDAFDPYEVVDLLDALVRRSMLVAETLDGSTRYRLLESIRQFGADRLEETGEVEATRAAHLVWCREFMAQCSQGLRGPDGRAWVPRLEYELDNWRTAIAFAVEKLDLDALTELLGSIPTLALYGTRTGNAFSVAGVDVLAAIGEPDHAVTGALLALACYDQYLRADHRRGVEIGLRGCEVSGRHPLPVPITWGFVFCAAYFGQDFDTALLAADMHIRIADDMADPYTRVEGLGIRAMTLVTIGRHDEAKVVAEETLTCAASLESPLMALETNFMVGFTYTALGVYEEFARSLLESAATLATEFENAFFAASAVGILAANASDAGPDAAVRLRTALELLRGLPQREVARDQFELVSSFLVQAARPRGAATLFGAASLHERNLTTRFLEDRTLIATAIGQDALDDHMRRGGELTVDEALAFAISELDAVIATDADTDTLKPEN
jgi:predicted ATPase/class 3 adenylate cyclase